MEVQNFECQIAQSQMSRYLSGEAFSPEAVKQLNEHIAQCVTCKSALAQRRASLQDQLSRPKRQPTKAVVRNTPQPEPLAIKGAVSETEGVDEAESKPSFVKPLLLSSALAVVLIGMTIISRDPTTLFGTRASASAFTPPAQGPSLAPRWSGSSLAATLGKALNKALQSNASVAPVQVPLNQIKPLTVAAKGSPIGGQIGDLRRDGYPQVTVYPPAGQKAPKASKPAASRSRNRSNSNSTPAPNPNRGVVIYDADGNPISHRGTP